MKRNVILVGLTAASLCLCTAGCGKPAVADPVADASQAAKIRADLKSAAAETATEGDAADTGPAGYASLKGRFFLDGTEPQRKVLETGAKGAECGLGGQPLLDNALLIDSDTKGIADVVVLLRTSKHKHPDMLKPESPTVDFDQKKCLFLSPVLVAQVGQTILVKNSDDAGHNTNIAGTSFNYSIAPKQHLEFPVKSETKTAPKGVSCNIHPWMQANMWFRADRYFAVTDKNGAWQIPNLPAGQDIELQVWHARAAGGGLALSKPELKWDAKGRFKLKLEVDEEKDLGDLAVPASALVGG